MLQPFVTTSRFLRSQKLQKKDNYLKLLTIGNTVAYLRGRETSTSYLNWMPKRADIPSDSPRPILVEFISGFLSFAKRINTPGTLAQGRTRLSARLCAPMKRSGRLLQEKMITESCMSSLESLWLLKRATISDAIAIAIEISLSLVIRKKTTNLPNTPMPNCRGMNTLEPICYKILGL